MLALVSTLLPHALTIGATTSAPVVVRGTPLSMQVAAPAPIKVGDALKSVTLKNAAGDSATVYTLGACVTSYVKGGVDQLMVRPDAKMDGSKPISGGIPHCFPQFGPGAIQQHGFARNLDWDVAEESDDKVVFKLSESDYTMDMWPNKFVATYTVTLAADALKTEFTVTNTDAKAWDFTAALHSYWSVSDIDTVKVSSPAFNGATFLDKMQSPPADVKSSSDVITFKTETDSVYAGVSGDVVLADSKKSLTIQNTLGWSDTVLWSPYGSEAMGYKNFVCVESAQAASSVSLAPGEYWTGAMNVVP